MPYNLYALAQAGYTQPKEHYSTAELERLSTSHLRRLGRERLGVHARRYPFTSRNFGWPTYWIYDDDTNFLVDEVPGTEDDLREWLIANLAD